MVKLPALSLALVLVAGPAVAAGVLEDGLQSLKDAVAKKDAPLVKKLVADLYPQAREASAEAAPKNDDDKPAWTNRVELAKSVEAYTEYALYAVAIQSPPETLVDLISTLEQSNPKSKYLDEAYGPYLVALNRTKDAAKVIPTAEKALANFPDNEDLLLVVTDAALAKNPDRALTLANRLVAAFNKHPKPESMSAADWERKKSAGLGRGYWIAGVVYGAKGQYVNCDKSLRAALPLIKGSDAMLGPALFYLGMSNYNLGKMTLNKAKILEAARFSEQSAAIAGAYTDQARHNATVMKDEAARMR
jgi:tetratricopeptide (TPR) repeat protein